MGWRDEGKAARKAQDAEMTELRQIRDRGGRGEPGSMDPDDFVVLAWRAGYVGGWEPMRDLVQIQINCVGMEFVVCGAWQGLPERYALLPWEDVVWIEFADGSRAKSRVAATVAFGVAGLGAKASEEFAEMLVHLRDGRIAAFTIEQTRASAVRAKAAATLASVAVPSEKPVSASPAAPSRSLVDELERLAALHAAGALTDDEYADFKQQLRHSS